MEKIIIIAVLAIILIVTITILIVEYNKFQWQIIKVNKGEVNIIDSLEKKYHILLRYFDLLKKNAKVNEEDFEPYKLLNTKVSINNLNNKIEEMDDIINKYLDNNEKLLKKDVFDKINKELYDINVSINGCKKYYNDNLVNYNNLCNKFPSNIISKIFKYQEKEFIEEEVKESLKILDE